MKLKFRILAIVLSLVLLFSCMSVFTVSAATSITPTGVQQHDTTQYNDWRIWLKVGETIPDGAYYAQDVLPVTVTDKDGNLLAKTGDGKTFAGFLHDGIHLMLQIFGDSSYTAQNDVKEGDTIVIAAGTYDASNTENSIVIAEDITLVFSNNKFVLCHKMGDNAVVIDTLEVLPNASSATDLYTGISSNITGLTYYADWQNRFFPADQFSGIFYTTGDVTKQIYPDGNSAVGMPVENYTEGVAGIGGGIYFNGFGTAVAGDKLTVKGDWYSTFSGEELRFYAPITFAYDGSAWTRTSEVPDTTVYTTYTGKLQTPTDGNATALYCGSTDSLHSVFTDGSWTDRLAPASDGVSGIYVDGVKQEVRGSNNGLLLHLLENSWYLDWQTAASEGSILTVKGTFVSEKHAEKVVIDECNFIWDGSKWSDYVPDTTVYTEYTGTFTNADSQVVQGTNPNQLYLKGSESLAGAFEGLYEDGVWNKAPLTALGDESGFYLNGEKVSVAFQQYTYSSRWYFASGMNAASAGDVLTLKGTFVNEELAVKINVEECKFIWDGTKWSDYVADATVYTDMTVSDVFNFSTSNKDWRFNLTMDGTWPTTTDFEPYGDLTALINETQLDETVVDVYKNGNYLMLCLWGNLTNGVAPVQGDTVTIKAGKSKASSDATVGINLTEDIVLTYDGSKWNLAGEIDNTVYNDTTITGIHSNTNLNVYLYLNTDTEMPGNPWEEIDGVQVKWDQKITINDTAYTVTAKKWDTYGLFIEFPSSYLTASGDVITIKAGKYKSNVGDLGYNLTADYVLTYTGTGFVDDAMGNITYSDVTVENLITFRADADWRFNFSIGGNWPTLPDDGLVKLVDPPAIYINETKLDSIEVYKNGNYLMFCLWGNLTNGIAPVKGDKVTIKAGKAQFNGTEVGINLLSDVVLEFDGEQWVQEGYVDNHSYSDITLQLPIHPTGYSTTNNRWDFYFPVKGTIPGKGDDGDNSRFENVKVSVSNSAGELILDKSSFPAWKAAYADGTFFFAIDGAVLPIDKLDKGSVMTIHAGKLASPVNNNGLNIVSDLQIKWTGTAWLSVDYDKLKPSETNVKLTIDRGTAYGGNANGVYLLTDDKFPVDTTWNTRIKAATYDGVSGVYLNDVLIADSNLCRFAEGKLYLALLDAGFTAKDKDKLTIKGMFILGDYAVSYKEYTLYFNGKHWNEKYETAPKETYTNITAEKVNSTVTSYSSKDKRWNVYLALDAMLPGDVDTMSFDGLKIIGADGKEYDVYVSHSYQHHLFVAIPEEVLPYNSENGAYVILKAGKALSPQDQCSGIQLTKDFKIYYYKGGLSNLEPTDNTLFEDVTITRLHQTTRFNPETDEWRFHWVIATPLENVESGVTFSELPIEVNGVTQNVKALRDGNYLYVRVPSSALPGDTQTAVISIKAGAKGYANSGHNGIQITNDWTAYVYRGVISEVEFDDVYCQEFDITGVQAATISSDRVHFYLRTNREMPGNAWYECYAGFTYYYNGQKVTTTAYKSDSSNNKFFYFSAVYSEIGIDAPQEGDIITVPVGSIGDGGGYQIQTSNEFTLVYSEGVWTQYVENNVEAPAASEGSIWNEFRFEEGFIPVLQPNGKVLWSNEDTFHDIISTQTHKDYTFNIEVQKTYDDETTPPFYVILRGNAVSEEDEMTASMLYGYVIQFAAAEIQDPLDPTNPDAKIWSQYISLWKNGVNSALIDQYRINYVHKQTDHPFFQYEDTHNYEFSVYNVDETTVCITVKVDGQLALRYYDTSSGLDPMDPAVNGGLFVVSASCPGFITGEAVDLGELIVASSECETNDRVRVAVTYPSVLDGVVFTVDKEGASIVNGVFTATVAGTYTISATYNGKDYGSKTIVVKDPPKRELLDVGGDETEFPWLIVGIAGGVVVVAAVVVLIILLAKRKKKAATPTAE